MILGIDFGDSRTGFAVSDPGNSLARTLETFAAKGMEKVKTRAIELAKEHTDTIMPGYTHLQKAQPVTLSAIPPGFSAQIRPIMC